MRHSSIWGWPFPVSFVASSGDEEREGIVEVVLLHVIKDHLEFVLCSSDGILQSSKSAAYSREVNEAG
jgi:hypothetical protein